ncbi:MAG: hypothetical protein R2774_10030 [Saprospiraceae bacterium]
MNTKKISVVCFILFFGFVGFAQTCYQLKSDPLGYNRDYISEVEPIACEIDQELGTNGQFKAFDYAVWSMMIPTFDGTDATLNGFLAEAKNASTYFINIVKIPASSPTIKEFYIDLSLPKSGIFQCLDESKILLIEQLVKGKMDAKLNSNLFNLGIPIREGLLELKRIIQLVKSGNCCPSDPEAIKQILAQRGYKPFNCNLLGVPTLRDNTQGGTRSTDVEDYANIDIDYQGQTLGSTAFLQTELSKLAILNLPAKGYITHNGNFCNNIFDQVANSLNANKTDYDIHWHLWDNPDPNGQDLLFEKMTNYNAYLEKTILDKLDDKYTTIDKCHGTNRVGRSGSTSVGKTVESWLIQLDYLNYNPNAVAEYAIPKAGKNGGWGYADLVDLTTLEIFEIKSSNEQIKGVEQVTKYLISATKECPRPPSVWKLGLNYPSFLRILPNPRNPAQVLIPRLTEPGVIVYDPQSNPNPPTVVTVPVDTWERIKRFMERLGRNPAEIDLEIARFLRENPDIATAIKTAAVTAGVVIIVGTIIEDVLTAGAGIADDWASFMVAYRLVKIAAL